VTSGMRHALVVGAGGVIGRGVVTHLGSQSGWRVTGVSRSTPQMLLGREPAGVAHVEADLLDPAELSQRLGKVEDITHLVYAAFQQRTDPVEEIPPNLAMLANSVQAVESAGHPLQHVTLFQGGKYYGSHLGPFKTPARESDPRHIGANFYFDQQDYLAKASASSSWTWTALRPEAVAGDSVGTPMNLLMVIAVYAAISKELGLPLRFPGTVAAYDVLYQMNEASLLGEAAVWAGTEQRCAGEAYNITNGDAFRWRHMFPVIADAFDMELADPAPITLARQMAGYDGLWQSMIQRHGLVPIPYEKVAAWGFGDFIFNSEYDNVRSDLKARAHGWNHFVDSEEMFSRLLAGLRASHVVP
jgi:nucleoside-diphosphate-sugar epimerase